MNIAVIFAGGIGSRMKTKNGVLKQFLEINDVPILIHTIMNFEREKMVDAIIVVMKDGFIEYTNELIKKYGIKKVAKVVCGGETGQESIYNGLVAADAISTSEDDIVLIHDGVRPFIGSDLIIKNIKSVRECGSAISCVPATETLVITDGDANITHIPLRANSMIAKAPQSFYLKDILAAHKKILALGIHDSIDSCTLIYRYKKDLAVVMTDYDNIKVTTPKDLYLAESIYKKRQNMI